MVLRYLIFMEVYGVNIQIIEKDFSMSYPMDNYKSFIWSERYDKYGDFEIYIPITPGIQEILKIDSYVWCNLSERLMIIEDIKTESDQDNGNFLIVTGKSLESIPERRIIWYPITFTDEPLQTIVKVLLEKNLINPVDSSRAIKNFIFEESKDERITSITKASLSCEIGDSLYEKLCELLHAYQIGYKIIPNDENQFVFSLYSGEDRSYSQETNPWIIFSPNQDNIISSRFNESTKDYKNVTLVLNEKTIYSEDDASAEPTVEKKGLILGSASGLSRRETFTDARSIDIDKEATDNDILSQMRTEGYKTLADNKYNKDFDGEVDYIRSYRYGTDFYLGDIVEITDLFGNEGRERVTEYMIKEDTNGFSAYPTFASITEDNAGSPYSLELKLGTEHTNAFYGDWGYEAYLHSKTTGNPHGTTWYDVGADEAGSAEKFYDKAKGDAQAAGNQALRNANAYTDNKIKDLIEQYVVDWTINIDNASEEALEEAKRFTEMLINELVGNAPSNLDTIYELADAIISTNNSLPGLLDSAKQYAKKYTDDAITALIGTSPENLDTIYELADAIINNKSLIDTLNTAITGKVSKSGDTMSGNLTVPQLIDNGLTPNKVVTTNGSKQLASSNVSTTELGYLSGASANIQTQINNINGKFLTNEQIVQIAHGLNKAGSGISSYPTTPGLFRLTGTAIAGLPSNFNKYGELLIYGNGYYIHILSEGSKMWIGMTADAVKMPTWTAVTTGGNDTSNKVSKTGDTMTGALKNSAAHGSWVNLAQGNVVISNDTPSSDTGSAKGLIRSYSTNGVMVDYTFQGERGIEYITNSNVSGGVNSALHRITLLNESGNTQLKYLNSYGIGNGNNFGRLPSVNSDGTMEIGRYLDFHYASGESIDYAARIFVDENKSNGLLRTYSDFKAEGLISSDMFIGASTITETGVGAVLYRFGINQNMTLTEVITRLPSQCFFIIHTNINSTVFNGSLPNNTAADIYIHRYTDRGTVHWIDITSTMNRNATANFVGNKISSWRYNNGAIFTSDVSAKIYEYATDKVGTTSSVITSFRNGTSNDYTGMPGWGAGIISAVNDTYCYLCSDYDQPNAYIGGGNNRGNHWVKRIATEDDIDSLKNSVSNGKKLVADAITKRGVSTSATADFGTMATNIGKISGGTTLKIDEYFIKNYLSEPEILTTAPNDGIIVGIFSQNPGAAPGTSVCYVEVNGSRVLSDGASREDGIIMARTLGKYHNVKKGDVIKGYINRGQQNPVYIMIYAHPK